MNFKKMHGLGNDFVILDLRDGSPLPARETIAALTDRKTGIGCDQFIPVLPPKDPAADAYMMILNAPDASEAEACGNATRCVARMIMDEKGTDRVTIETVAGLLQCRAEDDGCITANMGAPVEIREISFAPLPPSGGRSEWRGNLPSEATIVNVGNPHVVFFIDDVENFPVRKIGPLIEHHDMFPNRTNVEFVQVLSPTELRMRVWERDTGETEACGSAACATHVAAVRRGLAERKARVILNGGPLDFHWREDDDHILMTGPTAYVFEGVLTY